MRIALVITELNPGGAEGCMTELAIRLKESGCEVRVLALGMPPAPEFSQHSQRLAAANIDLRFGKARGLLELQRLMRWLKREFRDFAPDIVQSMLWHANVMSALALGVTARRNAVPVLVGGARVNDPRRGRWPVERWCARRMSKVVCVSEDVRTHAEHQVGIPPEKLLVIPNGISISALDRPAGTWSELGIAAIEHALLFVGRLEPQKGAMQLVEHLPEMLACLPTWQAVLIGHGKLQKRMQASVSRAGLTEKVHFVGWQPHAARWMVPSQVILLPALYEGMPNVLLEAMAAGRPFVAFAVDGVRQLVSDDYPADLASVQLAEPGDWGEFNRLVRRLANDANLRRRCGEANRQHVFKHFRLDDQLNKYLALYRDLLAQRSV